MLTLLAINTTTGLSDAGSNAGYAIAQSPTALVTLIISAVLSILGIVFLVLIIYGGFTWMTAAGNEKGVAKAKNILMRATIGLVIVLFSYAISSFILGALVRSTQG